MLSIRTALHQSFSLCTKTPGETNPVVAVNVRCGADGPYRNCLSNERDRALLPLIVSTTTASLSPGYMPCYDTTDCLSIH